MNAATQKAYQQAVDKAKQGQTAATTDLWIPPPPPQAPIVTDGGSVPNSNPFHAAVQAKQTAHDANPLVKSDKTPGSGILNKVTAGAQKVGDAGQHVSDWVSGGGGFFADGGEVDQQPSLLEQAGKLAPLLMMLKSGGPVPGKATVAGDSPKNDTVPAMLSAKEIVLPRSVTLSPDAPKKAAEFVKKVKKPEGYDALVKLSGGR